MGYKDCFKLMDVNKDGTLDKNDLRGAFDNIGVLMSESELDDLMGEVGGPCTVQGMIKMFQDALTTWGDKMTKAEIDDIFNEFEVDEDYMCKTKEVMGLFVAVKEEEKKVEEKKEEVAEEAPADDEGDAKKKM